MFDRISEVILVFVCVGDIDADFKFGCLIHHVSKQWVD
jgi:hypothetical protein